jgi:DNA-binding FadR family transcriptional regulator
MNIGTEAGHRPVIGGPVRAPKTAELIAHQIRRQIVKGELPLGTTLPSESELLAQYGVSRPTLREAFRILEVEMLISVRRGARGGAHVTAPDLSVAARSVGLILQLQDTSIEDVYEARCVIETACARMLAANPSQETIEALRACANELKELVDAGLEAKSNVSPWWTLPVTFHELITDHCGNKTLALQGALVREIASKNVHASVTESLDRAIRGNDETFLANFRLTYKSYFKYISYVEKRDAAAAGRHWDRHMRTGSRFMLHFDHHTMALVDLFD